MEGNPFFVVWLMFFFKHVIVTINYIYICTYVFLSGQTVNNDLSQPSTIMEQQFDMVIFFVVYPDRLGCEIPRISATWCNTRNCLRVCHLPETNNSHVKMDCWKTNFLLGNPIFGGCVKLPGCNSIQPKKKVRSCQVWAKKASLLFGQRRSRTLYL